MRKRLKIRKGRGSVIICICPYGAVMIDPRMNYCNATAVNKIEASEFSNVPANESLKKIGAGRKQRSLIARYDHSVKRGAGKRLQLLRSEKLAKFDWLVHGFSTRTGGVSRPYGGSALNLGFTKEDSTRAVAINRELFLEELFGGEHDGWPLVSMRQIHSDLIHRVDRVLEHPAAGDGIVTDTPGLVLAVQTADCLPIMLVDSKRRAAGVFHAGWRGTVKRIVEKGVGEMRRYFGTEPADLRAAIGPGVQACCYEVGEEIRTRFESQFSYASSLFREVKESNPVRDKYPLLFLTARAPGHSTLPVKLFLDLVEANRRQLLDAGLKAKNIDTVGPCTACHTDLLFSYRQEKGVTGRMMAAVGIRRIASSSRL